MKTTLLGFITALALVTWVTPGWAAAINGTLEKIDGQFYVVKDDKGKEYRVHFDATTKKTGEPAAGNRIEIDESNGHAKSIKVVEAKPSAMQKQGGE
jgi:hypothetical protein